MSDAEQIPIDPFDPERLRARPMGPSQTSKRVHEVLVHKPHKDSFFRVNPDPAYVTDVYVLEDTVNKRTTEYLVDPEVAELISREVRIRRVFVCRYLSGGMFLWPARLPHESGFGREWSDSALKIAESAMKHWVRMMPSEDGPYYDEIRAEGALAEPAWPDLSLRDLLQLGFRSAYIDSFDHEVLRARRGLA